MSGERVDDAANRNQIARLTGVAVVLDYALRQTTYLELLDEWIEVGASPEAGELPGGASVLEALRALVSGQLQQAREQLATVAAACSRTDLEACARWEAQESVLAQEGARDELSPAWLSNVMVWVFNRRCVEAAVELLEDSR